MENEPEEVGKFVLGIKIFKSEESKVFWGMNHVNEHVPIEIILAFTRAFLREREDKFYDGYNRSLAKFSS